MMGRGQQPRAQKYERIHRSPGNPLQVYRCSGWPRNRGLWSPCASSKCRNTRRALAGRRAAVFHPSLDLPFKHPSVFYKRQLSQTLCKAANSPCVSQMGKRSLREEPWLAPAHGRHVA